jgi:hypothetical protein
MLPLAENTEVVENAHPVNPANTLKCVNGDTWLTRRNDYFTSGPRRSHLPFFRRTCRLICMKSVSGMVIRSCGSADRESLSMRLSI